MKSDIKYINAILTICQCLIYVHEFGVTAQTSGLSAHQVLGEGCCDATGNLTNSLSHKRKLSKAGSGIHKTDGSNI